MNLSAQILFGVGMPQLGPVAGATVRIFKQFPGVVRASVSGASATTDGSGNFTLQNCDVSLSAAQSITVPALDVQVPAVTLPAWRVGVEDQTVNVPDFTVHVPGPSVHFDAVDGPLGFHIDGFDKKAPDFDYSVKGHSFVLKGATTTVPAVTVPATTIQSPQRTLTLTLPVPAELVVQITVNGQTFEQPYTPPIVLLNGAISFDLNTIGGTGLFLDTLHRGAIAIQQASYAWQGAAGLPGHIATVPPQELPPARYDERASHDATGFANGALTSLQAPYDPLALADFDKLAPVIAAAGVLPAGSDALHDDGAFAGQRLAGVNPLVIARVSGAAAIPPDFAGAAFAAAFRARFGIALAQAAEDRRLYVCDFAMLRDIAPAGPRFFRAPIALFFQAPSPSRLNRTLPPLLPVGIFLGGVFDPVTNPVVTPADAAWPVAKLIVQSADLNLHEMKSHLHDTHLVMEAAAVAMHRTMYWGHPIAELLRQHFHIMLLQGSIARSQLMKPGGTVDAVLGTGIAGSWEIVKRARARWTFAGAALEADLASRSMGDAPIDYPYRDDARTILGAIQRFVSSYVAGFYASDTQVHDDFEIQNWLVEMAHPDRGNLGAMPAVQTRDALAALVAQIIFTCSAQHSALNYPQYDYFGRVTNMPAAIWQDPVSLFAPAPPATPPAVVSFLPNKANAVAQIDLAYQLSDFRYDRLGEYRDHATGLARYVWLHPAGQKAADQFRADLAQLAPTMRDRDSRRVPALRYGYLLPENILNSISI